LLPTPPLDGENEEEDARIALVRQLLEYKRFKDAARALGSAADERSKKFARRPADMPPELQGVELEEVEVWDLLSAFGRMMTSIGRGPGVHEVRYDDTPVEVYAEEISQALTQRGTITFQALFENRLNRAEVVGLFLALLELIRKRRVRAEQARAFGTIYLFALEPVEEVDEPEPSSGAAEAADAYESDTATPEPGPMELDDEQTQ
jgi:segregation and condensation protein A